LGAAIELADLRGCHGRYQRKGGQSKEVQLDLAAEQFKKYRKLIGQKVFATGTLFHAHTGHHHKRLLLTLSEMRRTS
jgi:Domain of unknown function (DUF4431)